MVTLDRQAGAADGDRAASAHAALHRHLAHAPLPLAVTRGSEHTVVYANPAFCRLAGIDDDGAIGESIRAAFGGPTAFHLGALLDRAFGPSSERHDAPIVVRGAVESTWICTVWPVIASNGKPDGLGLGFHPVEENNALDLQRQIAEQLLVGALREARLAEAASAAHRRATFLAEGGRLLAESVDRTSTLIALARLALPTLNSWCIVDLLAVNGETQRLRILHPDPARQTIATQLEGQWSPGPDDSFGLGAMLRNPMTVAITADIDGALTSGAHNPENLERLRALGIGGLLTVPLVARGTLLGALTFVSAKSGHSFGPEEVQLAEDIGYRASIALDNSQLYSTALNHQQSAESANRAKTAFLGAMSHELRTPLNAIGGYVDLIDMGLRGPVTEEQHIDLARVKANQQHLLVLISEIINYARLGSGPISLALSDVPVNSLVFRAAELVEPLISRAGLAFEILSNREVVAHADGQRVVQVLVNLLSNAIKFTPAGGRIWAEVADDGRTVWIRVNDTGIGIPADRIDDIFDAFVQLDDTFAGREAGVGLGLAISRDLARAMGGDLTVESTLGQGSCFSLALPRAAAVDAMEG